MAQNIVILPDGTGQRGGVALDEVRHTSAVAAPVHFHPGLR